MSRDWKFNPSRRNLCKTRKNRPEQLCQSNAPIEIYVGQHLPKTIKSKRDAFTGEKWAVLRSATKHQLGQAEVLETRDAGQPIRVVEGCLKLQQDVNICKICQGNGIKVFLLVIKVKTANA